MLPEPLAWTHRQSRSLRFAAALFFVVGIAAAYVCLFDDPNHGAWWPYACAPGLAAIGLSFALWRGATWAVVAVIVLLTFAIVALLWEAFIGERAAVSLLIMPALLLAGFVKAFGLTTLARLRMHSVE